MQASFFRVEGCKLPTSNSTWAATSSHLGSMTRHGSPENNNIASLASDTERQHRLELPIPQAQGDSVVSSWSDSRDDVTGGCGLRYRPRNRKLAASCECNKGSQGHAALISHPSLTTVGLASAKGNCASTTHRQHTKQWLPSWHRGALRHQSQPWDRRLRLLAGAGGGDPTLQPDQIRSHPSTPRHSSRRRGRCNVRYGYPPQRQDQPPKLQRLGSSGAAVAEGNSRFFSVAQRGIACRTAICRHCEHPFQCRIRGEMGKHNGASSSVV